MPLTQRSKIAELRENAGLTQVQLASFVGVTPNTIQNWEKPDGLKPLERYLKLAELFGCTVEQLVEYVVDDTPQSSTSKNVEFSLEDVREFRKRLGTDKKVAAHQPKTKKPKSSNQNQNKETPGI